MPRRQIDWDLPDKHQVLEIPRPRDEGEVEIITHVCLLLLLGWKMSLDGSLASPTTSFLCQKKEEEWRQRGGKHLSEAADRARKMPGSTAQVQ